MYGYGTGIIKVHCKSSGKSCSGKTNIGTIFFGDTVSQGTFKYIYDVGPIAKFSRWGSVIRSNYIGDFKLLVVYNKSNFSGRVCRENIFIDKVFFNICSSISLKLVFVVEVYLLFMV